jgi:tetratricopeptide (TPR) repeat protein
MNTGIKAAGNLEFIYPGTRYIGHVGEYADWKINKENGKDISFYEQNNFGEYKSYHVFGKYTDFFGAYWHRDNFGMGRYSAHDEKAGKKIWIWGLSPQGMIWENLLSDTDGQYVEVQSGRLFNQASPGSTYTPFKHPGFTPSTTDTWTEYWFPVMNTGGFVKANDFGAINVRSRNGYLRLDFSALQQTKETLQVFDGDRLVYSKEINVKPLSVFSDSISFQGDANNLTVKLGAQRLEYRSNPNDGVLSRPVDSPTNFDWNSAYGLYVLGKEDLNQRFYVPAEEKLRKSLEKDPNYLPALSAMSMLMFRNMDYEKALEYALHALSIDTYDPAANFYYGQINVQLGNLTDAKDGFDVAALSAEYRGAAFTGLSKIYFSEGDSKKAIAYAQKALAVNTNNLEAAQIIATASRLNGDKNVADATLKNLMSLNPLNHFIRFEQYRAQPSDATANAFKSMINNELSTETYLQLADWYFSLGQLKESLAVLQLAPEHPEVYYWIAFLKTKLKEPDASPFIQKADAISPRLIFPFRPSSATVLKWVTEHSENWKPKYYLGLIYWSKNNLARAKESFTACGNPDYAPFYAARAALFSDQNYASDLRRAADLDPKEWRYGKLLINHLIDTKAYDQALASAQEYKKRFPTDFRVSMLLAKALLVNKQYKACSDLLGKTTILPYEGATDGRLLYREAWIMQGVDQLKQGKFRDASASISKARQWPEQLGVGKPYDADIDDRLEKYMEGLVLQKSKGAANANNSWKNVVDVHAGGTNANTLLTALALSKLGRADEGEKLLTEWLAKQPDNKVAQWCLDQFKGKSPAISNELLNDNSFRLVSAAVTIP